MDCGLGGRFEWIGFVPQAADLVFSARFTGARFVAVDLGGRGDAGLRWRVDKFGFVPPNYLRGCFGLPARRSFEAAKLFVAFVKRPFGAGAESKDAVEGFRVSFREQRVDACGGCQLGFEAIGAFDVPGGEDELIEQGDLDDVRGVEGIDVGIANGFELAVFFFVEQDGVLGEKAVLGCVGGGGGFAFGGARTGGVLGVGLIGFQLRGGGHFDLLLFVFEMKKGG